MYKVILSMEGNVVKKFLTVFLIVVAVAVGYVLVSRGGGDGKDYEPSGTYECRIEQGDYYIRYRIEFAGALGTYSATSDNANQRFSHPFSFSAKSGVVTINFDQGKTLVLTFSGDDSYFTTDTALTFYRV